MFPDISISLRQILSPLTAMFGELARDNSERRALENNPPGVLVRISCPSCQAPVFQLTAVVRNGERVRACRCCRTEFPVGV